MNRDRGERKTRRAVPIAVESLEGRIVLSAGMASAGVEIQYLRAVTHLNEVLQRRVGQIQDMLTRRVAHADARYEARLRRSAGAVVVGGPQVARAQVQVAKASATANAQVNAVVGKSDRQVGRFAAMFQRQVAGVTDRFGRVNATLRQANPYFAADFKNALTAIEAGVPAEGQAAQAALQEAAVPAQAQPEAAAGQLANTGTEQLDSERAVVAQFWEEYYASFNPLRAELASIASEQLPPVHLGGGGPVTGPKGHSGGKIGINGTGTGTVTFTGITGGDATTGSGFGIGSGVSGTGGSGNGIGTGTTTITGTGTSTTGVGSTITAGQSG